jgi:polyisoprenoid-binding protein YceI
MAGTTVRGAHFVTDVGASQFTAQVFSGGMLSVFGHNPIIAIQDFVGEVDIDFENVERSSLQVSINAAALTVKDSISEQDRREMERTMRQEILEVSSYPAIVYKCSNVTVSKTEDGQYSVTLNGDLAMHGVTRPERVTSRVLLGGDMLQAAGSFSVLQTDYKLRLASIAGGALKVKDEVKCSFNIVARRKE